MWICGKRGIEGTVFMLNLVRMNEICAYFCGRNCFLGICDEINYALLLGTCLWYIGSLNVNLCGVGRSEVDFSVVVCGRV